MGFHNSMAEAVAMTFCAAGPRAGPCLNRISEGILLGQLGFHVQEVF